MPSRRPLREIIAISDSREFLMELDQYVCPPEVMEGWLLPDILADLPPHARTVVALTSLVATLVSSGIGLYLTEHHKTLQAAIDSCRRVGATRATEYLDRVASCFPDGVLPSALECADAILDDIRIESCLHALDKEYADVPDEIATCVRSFVVANAAALE